MGTAMTVTWLINRRFTFKTHGTVTDARGMAAEGGRYGLVAIIAALVNYGVYALTLWSMPQIVWAGRNLSPPMAAVVGSGVAMFVSYYGYSRFAFRHGPHRASPGA
jgi:putative flippase GtrA